ncbi:T9SS type A sorting domain-containing protein [Chryseobacterium koreense]
MKLKTLFLGAVLVVAISLKGQFSSGTVSLGTTGMTVKIETDPTFLTLTLTGASGSFLGIGAGADGMALGADGFIYNASASRDYTFQGIGVTPVADAQQDWTIMSDVVTGSVRTVVARRTLAGGPGDVLVPNAAGILDIFYAKGSTLTLAQHTSSNRGYATLIMTPILAVGESGGIEKSFAIFPVPAKDVINFKNAEHIKSVAILDQSGKMVISEAEIVNGQLGIAKLSAGIYFVEVKDKSGNTSYQKMIKN